jgi:hypothetical protein
MLFAREDFVEEEWRIVAPILATSDAPIEYEPGTWGPAEADRLIAGSGGWRARPDRTEDGLGDWRRLVQALRPEADWSRARDVHASGANVCCGLSRAPSAARMRTTSRTLGD